MIKSIGLAAICAGVLCAQTIPASVVYSEAARNGIVYITPESCSAIISQKVATNWKTWLLGFGQNTAMAGVALKLSGAVSMSNQAALALTGGAAIFDVVKGLVAKSTPTGVADISPLLHANTVVAPGSEYSMCASSFRSVAAKKLMRAIRKQQAAAIMPDPLSLQMAGLDVTFTPQGTQTVLLAAGKSIKDFMIIDVIVSQPLQK